jgi:hypothetical protein
MSGIIPFILDLLFIFHGLYETISALKFHLMTKYYKTR